jgi:hypothetical protein
VAGKVTLSIIGTLTLIASGCRSSSPDVSRVAQAIARADSASHGPVPPYRAQIGVEDLPIAAGSDSDSVAWVNINQKYVRPKGGPQVIDYGVPMPPPHSFDGQRR